MRLRVGDLDFPDRQIVVRDSEGTQDRVTVLPDSVVPSLQQHLQGVKRLHDQDLAEGLGCVEATMIYTHLLRQGKPVVRSPLDDPR